MKMKLSSTADTTSPILSSGNNMVDIQTIKAAARGRWNEIFQALGGLAPEFLHFDKREGPCPMCGGNTRYRGIDEETGALFCSHCHNGMTNPRSGDGLSALQWLTSKPFYEIRRMMTEHLHLSNNPFNGTPQNGSKELAAEQVKYLTGNPEGLDNLLNIWCGKKPPITLEAVKAYGGRFCRWPAKSPAPHSCVAFVGRDTKDDDDDPRAILLYRNTGEHFPVVGRLGDRKTHLVRGSRESWIYPGTTAELQAATTVVKCEGPTDCLALFAMGLPDGWVAITNACGAKSSSAKKLDYSWAEGKTIVGVGDCDAPGRDGIKQFARAFAKAGAADIRLVTLPYEVTPDHGKDLRDFFCDGHTMDDFLALVEQAERIDAEIIAAWRAEAREKRTGRREIVAGIDESIVIDQAITALATRDNVYQRGGLLVHVVNGIAPPPGIARSGDAPRIVPMKSARIKEHLSDAADWFLTNGEERERIHPPKWVVYGIDARGQWDEIRRIEAVVESPVLRADGTVLQTAGYDQATGIFYKPLISFPTIPQEPSRDDAVASLDSLLEVVRDFPYATEAHRAGWIAGVLTPLARYAISGPAPMFLFDANIRGSGKSLQSDALSIIAAGRPMSRMSLPHDDDEFRKRITAIALAAEPLVLIDNINGVLGNASLDAALTATSWSDRILGQTAMASGVPLYSTWYATGNNVVWAADTSRRTVHIRLESREENPEERSDFLHDNLLAWVRQERPRLTTAAITILAAYHAAGRPDMGLSPWGSFESWSELVRNAVVWVGMPDPGSTRTELASQADREAVALRQLLAGWNEIDPSGAGMTIVEVLRKLDQHLDEFDTVRAALWELSPPKDGKHLNPRSVGMKLHHLRQRVIGGWCLDRKDSGQGAIWVVRQPEVGNVRDTSGTSDTSQKSAPFYAGKNSITQYTPAIWDTGGNSVTSPTSVAKNDGCQHQDIEELPTNDGFLNRQCRQCGKWLRCQKLEGAAP